jgi:hypothetical protein
MKTKLIILIMIVFAVGLIFGCGKDQPISEQETNDIDMNNTEESGETEPMTENNTLENDVKSQKTISAGDKTYFFGISPTDSHKISEKEWEYYKLIGIKSLRIHLQRSNSWSDYEKVLKRAAEEDIEVVMLVSYESYKSKSEDDNLGWGPILHFTNPLDLVDVLAEAIPHFKEFGVKAWEIWNEQNGMWNLRPNEYAELITEVYEKCKYTDKWDENAIIVFGGLDAVNVWFPNGINGGSQEWLTKFYKTEACKAFKEKYNHSPFDVMAIHPYNTIDVDGNLEVTMNDLKSAITGVVLKTMAKNGDGDMPVWITELGDQNENDEKNAKILELYMKTAYEMPQVTRFHWFKYLYVGSNYSIVKQGGAPRPSLYAYARVVKELTGQ